MTITPDQARALLDGATPGPWCLRETDVLMNARAFHIRKVGQPGIRVSATTYGHNDDPELIAAAPDMAETIAGMRWQYGAQCGSDNRLIWRVRQEDAESLVASMSRIYPEGSCRLVRRLVGPVEVVAE